MLFGAGGAFRVAGAARSRRPVRSLRMMSWLRTWVTLAATAWPVGILALAVHAAIGHGLVAELTGGRFLSLFVSPAAVDAEFYAAPGARRLIALGAAAPLTATAGLLLWRGTRRSPRFVPRVAGWYAGLGAIGNIVSWGLFPWLLDRTGRYHGDWSEVWRSLGVPARAPGIVALIVIALLAAPLIADARRILNAHHETPWRRGLSASYWLMVSAAALPAAAYAIAFWPYWRPNDLAVLGGVLAFPLPAWAGGMIALPLARRWSSPDDGPSEPASDGGLRLPDAPGMLACVTLLLATTLGAASLFGPATRLRTGFAVRPLTSGDYWELESRKEVEWAFEADGAGRLTVRSSPPVASPSLFEEQRAGEIDRLGPSPEACDRILKVVAAPIEGVALTAEVAAPERTLGAWRCAATVRAEERGLSFVVPEGAAALSVLAPGLATRRYSAQGVPLGLSSGAARWVRPDGFRGTDTFRVKF